MKVFNSFNQVEFELRKLNLERKISIEELRAKGYEMKGIFSFNWKSSAIKSVGKFGLLFLLKRLFKIGR